MVRNVAVFFNLESTPHSQGNQTVPHTHRPLFCRLCYLTPPTPGKYITPTGQLHFKSTPHPQGSFLSAMLLLTLLKSTPHPQGSFLLAMLLNPSYSWKVHHTHRDLFCRLRFLTPQFLNASNTPGKYTTPTGLFFDIS